MTSIHASDAMIGTTPPADATAEIRLQPPGPWQLELIKQYLAAAFSRQVEEDCLLLLDPPAPEDMDGQLRLAGLLALCDAQGKTLRLVGLTRPHGSKAACIRLGPGLLQQSQAQGRVLVWPAPEHAVSHADSLQLILPDPMHALWGILDCAPEGHGQLRIHPGAPASSVLPQRYVQQLRFARACLPAWAQAGALRHYLQAARRSFVGHAEVACSGTGQILLATMLQRDSIVSPALATIMARYWRQWT